MIMTMMLTMLFSDNSSHDNSSHDNSSHGNSSHDANGAVWLQFFSGQYERFGDNLVKIWTVW